MTSFMNDPLLISHAAAIRPKLFLDVSKNTANIRGTRSTSRRLTMSLGLTGLLGTIHKLRRHDFDHF